MKKKEKKNENDMLGILSEKKNMCHDNGRTLLTNGKQTTLYLYNYIKLLNY